MAPNKSYWSIIKKVMMILAFVAGLGTVAGLFIAYGQWKQSEIDYKENQKLVTFTTPKDKVISDEHMNSDYTPVKSFQGMQRMDSIYTFALEQFQEKQHNDSINHALEHYNDSIKKLKDKKVERSRAGRDSINILILEQLQKLNDTTQ